MKKTIVLSLIALAASQGVRAENTADAALLKQGEYLARAGDCVACHTAAQGKPYAGGLAMQTPIGTLYSSNITPDKETGIGLYSFEEFDRAVRHGIARNGDTLYPAMPYPSYAKVSDPDMQALYAYFMHGVPAVSQPSKASDIPWPLSMRWPLGLWRLAFAPKVEPAPAPLAGQDPVLARGAYLVEGLGHCGACHTPRAITLNEKALAASDGPQFLSGGEPQDGWVGKNLRGDHRDGLGSWTEEELATFFKTGRSERTAVFGSMGEVVVHSLQYLSDDDRLAIARYLKSLPARDARDTPFKADPATAQALHAGDAATLGARLYADNCMACHRSDGQGYAQVFPALAGNPVVTGDSAHSLIRLVLQGATLPSTHSAVTSYSMPPLGWRLSDQEVAAVLSFVRTSWGNQGAAVDGSEVAQVRKGIEPRQLLAPGMDKAGAIR